MRKIILRSLQGFAAIGAVALLTGANDAGCGILSGGGSGTGGSDTGGSGGSVAVGGGPAGTPCPDGSVQQIVCGGPGDPGGPVEPPQPGDAGLPKPPPPPSGGVGGSSATGGDPPPPPPGGGCSLQCVPAADACPPGTIETIQCDPGGVIPIGAPDGPNAGGSGGANPGEPPPPQDAGPGDPPPPSCDGGAPPPPACVHTCVPGCPPGADPVFICAGGGDCHLECLPHGCGSGDAGNPPPQGI